MTDFKNTCKDPLMGMLEKYFGFKSFREGQEDLIRASLAGRDVVGILPTGGGKSLCYQLTALMLDGISIVISPLISLMKDQVDSLKEIGVGAAYINSTLDPDEANRVMGDLRSGNIKILYIAPERLESDFFLNQISALNIAMVVIDEAHCISQWGHDFRPSYRNIWSFIDSLSRRPRIGAYTATATRAVQRDIISQLDLADPYVRINSFDRPNIKFILKEPRSKDKEVYKDIEGDESIIIYASTRKNVDNLYHRLAANGVSVGRYHAGLSEMERSSIQEDFIRDKVRVMVCTNAFGMGIDKPDVRKVIHYNMPKSMEAYYQEAGRAGRDGDKSEAILYFANQDIVTAKMLNASSDDPNNGKRLDYMIGYSYTSSCQRRYILKYFGEDLKEDCGNCSACLDDFVLVDRTVEAQKIMSCIVRTDQVYGMDMIAKVLKGSKEQRILDLGFDKLSTHGIMDTYNLGEIKDIISGLIHDGYIRLNEYRGLALNASARDVLTSKSDFYMKEKLRKEPRRVARRSDDEYVRYEDLYEILRDLRTKLAKDKSIPPYMVFHNSVLRDMANKLPRNLEDFLSIEGIGEKKAETYGKVFLEAIESYIQDKGHCIYLADLNDSEWESVSLYREGNDIGQIAQIRRLSTNTIFTHLYKAGRTGDFKNFRSHVGEDDKLLIKEAIEKLGYEKLKPIKEALKDEITYDMIRSVVLEVITGEDD